MAPRFSFHQSWSAKKASKLFMRTRQFRSLATPQLARKRRLKYATRHSTRKWLKSCSIMVPPSSNRMPKPSLLQLRVLPSHQQMKTCYCLPIALASSRKWPRAIQKLRLASSPIQQLSLPRKCTTFTLKRHQKIKNQPLWRVQRVRL